MAFVNIGSLYPTKIPGYDDAADIQLALRAYHYGSETYDHQNTNPSLISEDSVAGQLRDLDGRIVTLENTGIGSDYTATEPTSPEDGFIWVKSDTVAPTIDAADWENIASGSLSGTSLNVSSIAGQKFYAILKDWTHNNTASVDGLRIRFNSVSGLSYVLSPAASPDNAIYLSEIEDGVPNTVIINVDLSNTSALLKPLSVSGSNESHSGYFIDVNSIQSVQISLANGGSFSAGAYQVWSYR